MAAALPRKGHVEGLPHLTWIRMLAGAWKPVEQAGLRQYLSDRRSRRHRGRIGTAPSARQSGQQDASDDPRWRAKRRPASPAGILAMRQPLPAGSSRPGAAGRGRSSPPYASAARDKVVCAAHTKGFTHRTVSVALNFQRGSVCREPILGKPSLAGMMQTYARILLASAHLKAIPAGTQATGPRRTSRSGTYTSVRRTGASRSSRARSMAMKWCRPAIHSGS